MPTLCRSHDNSDLAKAQEAQRSGSRQNLRPSAGTVTLLTELMVAGA
jgi:hypothetical protein